MSLYKKIATLGLVLALGGGALTLGGCRAEGEVDTDGDHRGHGIEHRSDADVEIRGDVDVE